MNKASESLKIYTTELLSAYRELTAILELEAEDIAASDEVRLSKHIDLDQQTVGHIRSLTKSVRTYIEKTSPDEESLLMLSEIRKLREAASKAVERNMTALTIEMDKLKLKMASVKLPQSARRVYYSGNNPTLMDIEI